jgi:hypothetical protein
MAQSETAPTHEGTTDSAAEALSNFNFDTNEMEEPVAPEAVSEEAVIEEVDEEELEEDLATDEPVDEVEAPAETEVPAIDAPVSWDAEQKEVFSTLPPEAQKIVVAREGERDKGFQAKATELADEKRVMSEERQAMNIERQNYAQTLSDKIGEQLKEPNIDLINPNSANYNPELYHGEKTQFDNLVGMQQQAKQQVDYYAIEAKKTDDANKKAFWDERSNLLSKSLPEFIGDAQYRDSVITYAKGLGYTDEGLQNSATEQDIVTINKAMQYDKIIAAKVGVGDKLKVVPKVVKPGTRQVEPVATRRNKANMKAHKKSGNVASAAKLLEDMF